MKFCKDCRHVERREDGVVSPLTVCLHPRAIKTAIDPVTGMSVKFRMPCKHFRGGTAPASTDDDPFCTKAAIFFESMAS